MKSICVFCASARGTRASYARRAEELGRLIAERGSRLVYGGGKVGLMGAIADAALAAKGQVIGVIPQSLMDKELGHTGVTELRIVKSMHERKALMADLSDAFIAMPGGFGTLEEFCEVLSWGQLGLHRKPFGLLNVEGYYDAFLKFLDHAVAERLLLAAHRSLVLAAEDPGELLRMLGKAHPPAAPKWITRKET